MTCSNFRQSNRQRSTILLVHSSPFERFSSRTRVGGRFYITMCQCHNFVSFSVRRIFDDYPLLSRTSFLILSRLFWRYFRIFRTRVCRRQSAMRLFRMTFLLFKVFSQGHVESAALCFSDRYAQKAAPAVEERGS